MRVVLDTNVLISAFISRTGAPAQIFALWRNGEIEILVSPESLAELQRVLTYPRVQRYLQYTSEQIERFLTLLRSAAEMVDHIENVVVVDDDPDDNKFFAIAVAAQAQYIISGDKAHVLPVSQYQGIQVVTPATFLQIVQNPR
jgi:uncharacterized protein